jgi:hypothetical protein
MSSPTKVFVSSALADRETYLFSCRCGGDSFKLIVNRQDLDRYDEGLDPTQPISHRMTRLPRLVAPQVLVALRDGRESIRGIMRLSFEHLPHTTPLLPISAEYQAQR